MQKRRFSNHTILTFIVIFSLLIGVLVLAQTTTVPNPGHNANQILVDVTGTQQDLQQAFAGLESRIATLETGTGGSATPPPPGLLTPGNCA